MADEQHPPQFIPVQVNQPPVVQWDLATYLDGLGTRIDQGFSRIEEKLNSKADKADLAAINARLDEHGKDIGRLKDQQRDDEAAEKALKTKAEGATSKAQRHWNVGLGAALVAVGLLGVLAAVFHW